MSDPGRFEEEVMRSGIATLLRDSTEFRAPQIRNPLDTRAVRRDRLEGGRLRECALEALLCVLVVSMGSVGARIGGVETCLVAGLSVGRAGEVHVASI